MADVSNLCASSFDALYVELRNEMIAASDEMIFAGLGMVPSEEIRKLAENGDPLVVRYVQAQEAFQEVAYEKSVRLHRQDAAKPIWNQISDLGSALSGHAKKAAWRSSNVPAILPKPGALLPG